MTPDPNPTPAERAEELEVAAKIAHDHGNHVFAHDHGNHVFAQELTRSAHHLRMQEQQDLKEQKP